MSAASLRKSKLLAHRAARVLGARLYAVLLRADKRSVVESIRHYRIGHPTVFHSNPAVEWAQFARLEPGLRIVEVNAPCTTDLSIPFVYESVNARHLAAFRADYQLESIIAGKEPEFEAMLALGSWLGTRWDHGSDPVPGGNIVCNPADVIAAGQRGAKFWCEIAAKTTVQAANALGWLARLTTASRDGYVWEHAVAELWSNQFNKWFILDTDFNVVYLRSGVPLSAFELCHEGEQLSNSGTLTVHQFAPPKPSLEPQDLTPYYRYVHVDLRSDWCSRRLARGSPAGGDLSTWWTARPGMRRVITAKRRVDEGERFDWKVNWTAIHPLGSPKLDGSVLTFEIGLTGYSPQFDRFELQVDSAPFKSMAGATTTLRLKEGKHVISARLVGNELRHGPTSRLILEWTPS